MSLANAIQLLSSYSCLHCGNINHNIAINHRNEDYNEVLVVGFAVKTSSFESNINGASKLPYSRKRRLVDGRWRLNATDTRMVDNASARTTTVEIPVTCYQLIGVSDQAEKDEVVKSVMNLKRAEIEEGYTMEAVMSRQNLLIDVRDKLLFEPEYSGDIKERIQPKSLLRIPWAWLPGALCLLQEVGQENLVLDIGKTALQHPDAKPYIHDLLLSMALAECAIAKIGFEKNKVSQGFEALARAQCLLRSKLSLGKMALLSQIEKSLEELAPACTLELLGMPHSPENAERRRGSIAALRELLRQGLDVESSCEVKDWTCFLSQALHRMMASEIVDLLPWDNIATIRKNKKSLESQNQRVVVDFNSFYMVLIAYVAVGFSSKQIELIDKAKTICECLMTSEGIDLKFEEALCLFFLGQGSEVEALEKLRHLESNPNSAAHNFMSGKALKNASGANPSLEAWLYDAVLTPFPDTRDCSPSLANFFRGAKKDIGSKKRKESALTTGIGSHRSLSTLAVEQRDLEVLSSSGNVGSAVKQLAPVELRNPLILGKNSLESNSSTSSVQLKRSLGLRHNEVLESWLSQKKVVKMVGFVTGLGCALLFTLTLFGVKLGKLRSTSAWPNNKPRTDATSIARKLNSSFSYNAGPAFIKGTGFTGRIKKLLQMTKMQLPHSNAGYLQSSCLPTSLSTSVTTVHRIPMPTEEAEDLVKRWQAIKAEALGPSHQIHSLSEALDESMLVQWEALADTAKARSCYWRFVLLQLTILQADIICDDNVGESAEIEALLEEAAELVGESQPKNSNYYSTYKIHYALKKQDDGSWKFCEGDIRSPE